jgi:FkbM family methyltransferase
MPLSTVLKGFRRSHEVLMARWQTPAASKLIASYLNIGSQSYPMDIPLRSGGSVRVFTRGEAKVFWQIFIHGCYRLWPDCATIVDAGANIGMFSVWAALRLPKARIVAIEPSPETFAKLQQNIELNQLGTRVEALQSALAAQSGMRAISEEAESQRRTVVAIDSDSQAARSVKVASITLPELMERYQLRQVDLLKMDIEGSEWEVLHSTPPSVLRSIRRMEFEYHEVPAHLGYSKERLFDYLESTGFRLLHRVEDDHGTGIAMVEREQVHLAMAS